MPHSYVTGDLSKRSFRLSAGGGPRHLARVDGGAQLITSDNEDNGADDCR